LRRWAVVPPRTKEALAMPPLQGLLHHGPGRHSAALGCLRRPPLRCIAAPRAPPKPLMRHWCYGGGGKPALTILFDHGIGCQCHGQQADYNCVSTFSFETRIASSWSAGGGRHSHTPWTCTDHLGSLDGAGCCNCGSFMTFWTISCGRETKNDSTGA